LAFRRYERDRLYSDCEECQRLWREYAVATTNHIRLDSKLRLAALERDLEGIRMLTIEVETAERERAASRDVLRRHEAEAHSVSSF
jgi:hypothetical protein